MTKLVSTAHAAQKNIQAFRAFIEADERLADRLGYHRAWYAVRDGDGWSLGSSKIVGYAGLTPEQYLAGGHDGRQTEAVLQQWFREVDPTDPLHDELREALTDFLEDYGKTPSRVARINVLREEVTAGDLNHADAVCDLIVEVARGLDPDRIRTVRKRLKSMI